MIHDVLQYMALIMNQKCFRMLLKVYNMLSLFVLFRNNVVFLFHICFNGLLSYFVGKEPFVGLVLHSGLESSLPSLQTSTKLANRDKYKNIGFIDMAFTKEEKLYKCEMNETAKMEMKSFFDTFYKHEC